MQRHRWYSECTMIPSSRCIAASCYVLWFVDDAHRFSSLFYGNQRMRSVFRAFCALFSVWYTIAEHTIHLKYFDWFDVWCVRLSMPINNAGLRFLLCFQTTVNDDSWTSFYSSSFTSRLLFCLINKFVAMRKYAVGLCVFHQSATFMEWNISFVIDSLSPFSYKLIRN